MVDDRLGKGVNKNRLQLYVSNDNKALLEQLLEMVPADEAPSLSSAVFEVIRQWLVSSYLTIKGFLPSIVPGHDLNKSLEEIQKDLLRSGIPTGQRRTELLQNIFLVRALVGFERQIIQYDMISRSAHPLWPEAKEAITGLISSPEWKNIRSIFKHAIAESAWIRAVLRYVAVAQGISGAYEDNQSVGRASDTSYEQPSSETPSFDKLSNDEILQLLESKVGTRLFRDRVDLVQSLSRAQEVIERIKEVLRKQSNEAGTSNERKSKEGDHEEEKQEPINKTEPQM